LEDIVVAALDELLPDVHAVAVMDQIEQPDCGVVTQRTREILADRAREHNKVVFFADSRRRIKEFKRLIIKPNQFETVGVDDPQPGAQVDLAELQSAGMTLRKENEAPVIITCGELGMVVSDPDWLRVPGIRIAGEIDPTGAGDSVTAGTVLALCAGATLPEAAVVGNLVASITVQQLATTGVARPEQLAGQLEQYG
jgi:bifunctional ADP-heptose synthase (sugar kinase/adenylyltransferase)